MDVSGNVDSATGFLQEYTAYVKEREDLDTPHKCEADPDSPDVGASLTDLDSHATDFHQMVEQMFEQLPTETRVLDGVEIPTYDEVRTALENELSGTMERSDNGRCDSSVDS
jgi:hypothetical protein